MSNQQITAAVIGTGHLGRHHVRILNQMDGVKFLGAYDTDADRLAAIGDEHGVRALSGVEEA